MAKKLKEAEGPPSDRFTPTINDASETRIIGQSAGDPAAPPAPSAEEKPDANET